MVVMPNGNASLTAVFGPSGSLQLARTPHRPFLQGAVAHRRVKLVEAVTMKPPEAPPTSSPNGLSSTIAVSAAMALSGSRADADSRGSQSRRPTREARKALQQIPTNGNASDEAKSSRIPLVGAIFQLAARGFAAVGLIMQRMASDDDNLSMLRKVGIAAYLATVIPDVLSYLEAPHALIAVLSSVEPLLVSVLAALLLPQDAALLTAHHSLATALCVFGIVGCAVFAPSGGSLFGGAAAGVQDPSGLRHVSTGIPLGSSSRNARGVERLFQTSNSQRLMIYLFVAVPVLIYLMKKAHKRKMSRDILLSSYSCDICLPLVAAISLALQRLALDQLGAYLRAVHWQTWPVILSPSIVCTTVSVAVCTVCCGYHVCQGMVEAPAHIFVPTYCTMASLLRLFQSMVILREFRDEPTEKVFLMLCCAAASLFGVLCLHTARGKLRSSSKASLAGPPGRHDPFHCLEPVPMPAFTGGAC